MGYYSDAIDKFSLDSVQEKDPAFFFFPDWGVFMGFVMLTQGSLPYSFDFEPQMAHDTLCHSRDVVVVLALGKAPERLTEWTKALGWTEPSILTYRQRDGKEVLRLGRWKAAMQPKDICM